MSSTTGTDLVIETSGLRKEFSGKGGTRVAVDDLDLAVPRGGVHGFLGPNGSGKTATIRMLLGLARPTAGTMALFGTPVPDHLDEVIGRVGAVVESPKFSPTFSARQNLLLLARSVGVADTAVDDALVRVGLGDRAEDRFRSYSLGMKQRLAIAATLLKSPDLLIRDLGEAGVTVLLSSHILAKGSRRAPARPSSATAGC